tara:strand:+ start:852 stop:1196 length:345 start_codon:yes stop_codon:yes gene_type:complete
MLPSQNRKKENKMRISEEEMMEKLGLRLLIETVNGVDEQKLDHTYLSTVCGLSFYDYSVKCGEKWLGGDITPTLLKFKDKFYMTDFSKVLSFPEVSELCNALGDLDYTYGRLDN